MTEGVTCAHCGIRNHTEAQCWTKNKELRPMRYKPVANLALLNDHQENIKNDMRWENEHLAREQRSKRYELEKDLENKPENSPTDENSERYQFMANFNSPTPEQDSEEQRAEDERMYNESLQTMRLAAFTADRAEKENGEDLSTVIFSMHIETKMLENVVCLSDHGNACDHES